MPHWPHSQKMREQRTKEVSSFRGLLERTTCLRFLLSFSKLWWLRNQLAGLVQLGCQAAMPRSMASLSFHIFWQLPMNMFISCKTLPQIMAWHTDWMWRRVVLSWWGRPFEVIGDFAWSFLLRTWNDSTWRWCMALYCLRSKNWISLCDSFELPKRHKATKTRLATKTTTRPEIRPTRPTRPPRLTGVLRLSPALVALLFNLSR